MNPIFQISNSARTVSSSGRAPSLDAIRVVGPARERLLQRFGTSQLQALEDRPIAGALPAGVGIATDKGLRMRNEDSAIVMLGTKATNQDVTPFALAAIADGMGGHDHGDRASAIAIETLAEHVVKSYVQPDHPLTAAQTDPNAVDEMLAAGVWMAHTAIRREVPGGGSTLTCLLVADEQLHVTHVGDSRLYMVKAGGVDILTRDHLIVRRMEEVGILTHEEADRHPQRHVLSRALGMDDEMEIDSGHRPLQPSTAYRLLLCTDGVWGPLTAKDIYISVLLGQNAQDICEQVIRSATLRQANDNATAVLLHLPGR